MGEKRRWRRNGCENKVIGGRGKGSMRETHKNDARRC
jgi:hypothetical protein